MAIPLSLPDGSVITQIAGGRSNVFLLATGNRYLLIDTGTTWQRSRIVAGIRQMGIAHIDWILLTHSHFDHAANARFIADAFGAQVMIHRSGAPLLERGENPPVKGTNRLAGFLTDHFGSWYMERQRYQPCPASLLFDDTFNLNGLGFEGFVFHTPGHSFDSVSLVCGGVAFAGDTLFGVFPGRAFPPFAINVAELLKSWRRLLTTDCHTFLPGHGRAVTREVLEKEFLRIKSNIS